MFKLGDVVRAKVHWTAVSPNALGVIFEIAGVTGLWGVRWFESPSDEWYMYANEIEKVPDDI